MIKVEIRKDLELGVWQGIGGAITEATGYNFAKLSKKKQEQLLNAYYGEDGLDYRWGRISIGSNDFCLSPYEYTKKRDMSDFSIERDRQYILPMLKKVVQRKQIRIIAVPWSPPSFMKLSRMTRHGGFLKPWCYGKYAKYIRKWIDVYAKEGIKIDYLSPQNEPHAIQKWESCLFSYGALKKLSYKYLAEELKDYELRFLLWDHNKKNLPEVADELLNGKFVSGDKVAGLCYHWYDGTCEDEMWRVRQDYPDITMISSEMCCGFSRFNEKNWQNDAKMYLFELFSNINCGASAWLDWNMLLDWKGGPSYCDNNVKSPIILNEQSDDFILTPIYKALKRFAKLFPAGSEVVRCENPSKNVAVIARKTKIGYEVVAANVSREERGILIKIGAKEQKITLKPAEIDKISF